MHKRERTLSGTFSLYMTGLTFIAIVVFAQFSLSKEYSDYRKESAALKAAYIKARKDELKEEVEKAIRYVRYKSSQTEQRLKQAIRNRVEEAHAIASHIYDRYHAVRTEEEVKDLVRETLRPIRFNRKRGYYFATNLNGIEELFADRPEMEGKNLLDIRDIKGQYVIRDMIDIAQNMTEGFYTYHWSRPQMSGTNYRKIAFVKRFAPLNWLIGTGDYLDDMNADIQNEALDRLIRLRFGKEGYIFGSTYQGEPLFTNGRITKGGKSIWELTDPAGIKIIQQQREIVKNPDGGFQEYSWMKISDEKPSPKISFVRGIEEWEWIIGAGAYVDDIESVLIQKRELLSRNINTHILKIILSFLVMMLFIYFAARLTANRISNHFNIFFSFFRSAARTDARIDEDDLVYSEFRMMAQFANRMVDERRRIEDALKTSESRYRELFDSMSSGVAVYDAMEDGKDFVFKDFNRTSERLDKTSKDELIGRKVTEVFPGVIEFGLLDVFRLVWKTGKPKHYPVRMYKDDRLMAWRENYVYKLPSGEIVAVYDDVSEQKKAEDALKESEERYRALVEASPTSVSVLQDGHFIFTNPAGAQIFKIRDPSEIIGKNALDVVAPAYRDVIRERLKNIDAQKFNPAIEIEILRTDGTTLLIETTSVPIRLGKRAAALLIGQDITERKKAERELRKTKQYLNNILNSSPSPIIGIDPDSAVTLFNPAAEGLTGVPSADALGKNLSEIFPSETEHVEDVRKVIRNGEPRVRQRVRWEFGGKIRYYDLMMYPLVANHIEGAVIRIDEITERVRFEEMMVQTEKMMSVGGLAAGMAHEINNPLGGILQSIQNIFRRLSPDLPGNEEAAQACGIGMDAVREYLERRRIIGFLVGIQESGEKAAAIVSNMLSFSRRSDSVKIPVDLVELLNRTVELAAHDYDLRKKYDFRKIEIIRKFPEDFPLVACNSTEIEQVVLNLLRNAAQAMSAPRANMPPPRISLKVSAWGENARITVSDNGPGLNEESRKRAFEPFFTTKEVGRGTGLGLSVSYFIITTNHGGAMTVESVPGRGAEFTIELPFSGNRIR